MCVKAIVSQREHLVETLKGTKFLVRRMECVRELVQKMHQCVATYGINERRKLILIDKILLK